MFCVRLGFGEEMQSKADALLVLQNHIQTEMAKSKEYVNITTKKPMKMFDNFLKHPFCLELGESILDYCTYLCKLEKLKN